MFHWQRLLPPGGAGKEGFQRLLQNILKNNLPSAVEDSPLKVKQGSSCGQKAWQEGRRALAISRVWLSAQPFQRKNSFQVLCQMERKWRLRPPPPLPLVPCLVPSSTPHLWKGTQSFKVRPCEPAWPPSHLPEKPRRGHYTTSILPPAQTACPAPLGSHADPHLDGIYQSLIHCLVL